MQEIINGDKKFEDTFPLRVVLGKKVIAPSGLVVGHVVGLRINDKELLVEGILCRKLGMGKIYFGKNYIDALSPEAVLLSIEPTIFLRGKKVITSNGKVIGKVGRIFRVNNTNKIGRLEVARIFRKNFEITPDYVATFGKNIILKDKYDEKRQTKAE